MPTSNMNLTLPTDHGSSDIWDVVLDAVFGLIDSHDHTTGKGVPIPSAALKINADVTWAFGGTNYAIVNAKAYDLVPTTTASVASYSSALFSNSQDSNNLYYRNSGGTNVQITSGGTLNVSIVGGIGGDYASVSALLSYEDSTKRYLLQQQGSPRPWAGLATADIDLYQKAASIVNKVTLKSPNALGASYSLTMPGALPSATSSIVTTSAGQLQYADSVVKTLLIPAAMFGFQTDSGATATIPDRAQDGLSVRLKTSTATVPVICPIPLCAGDTITGWKLFLNKTSAAGTITAQLYKADDTAIAGGTAIGTTSTNGANNPGAITLSKTSLSEVAAVNFQYYVRVDGGGTTGDTVFHLEVTYTRALG